MFDLGRLVERRDDNNGDGAADEDGNGGGGQDSVMAAFSFGERILSMAANGSDVILGEVGKYLTITSCPILWSLWVMRLCILDWFKSKILFANVAIPFVCDGCRRGRQHHVLLRVLYDFVEALCGGTEEGLDDRRLPLLFCVGHRSRHPAGRHGGHGPGGRRVGFYRREDLCRLQRRGGAHLRLGDEVKITLLISLFAPL